MSTSLTEDTSAHRQLELASSDKTHHVKVIYFVTAVADPNLLPRLLEPFAKLNLIPDRVHADLAAHGERGLNVDLRISAVDARYAMLLEKALRAVIGVQNVISVLE